MHPPLPVLSPPFTLLSLFSQSPPCRLLSMFPALSLPCSPYPLSSCSCLLVCYNPSGTVRLTAAVHYCFHNNVYVSLRVPYSPCPYPVPSSPFLPLSSFILFHSLSLLRLLSLFYPHSLLSSTSSGVACPVLLSCAHVPPSLSHPSFGSVPFVLSYSYPYFFMSIVYMITQAAVRPVG